MNLQGKLHAKFDVQEVSERFRKREFVIEYVENPMYPQYILFQLIQDKVNLLDAYEVGAQLDISFNLKGRSWVSPQGETRYFNSLEAWRLVPVQSMQPSGGDVPPPPPPPEAMDVTSMSDDDDLPF